MSDATTLATFTVLALAGSLHCVGMCGGFAIAVASSERTAGRRSLALGLYAVGKALAYAVLGVAVAVAVERATGHEPGDVGVLHDARRWLAWFAGGALVLTGASVLGARVVPRGRIAGAVARGSRAAWSLLGGLSPAPRSFAIGFATGFLPCGLSWSALVVASQTSPDLAALGMFGFGLATGPALAATGLAGNLPAPRLRALGRWAAGPLLMALGVVTVVRGGVPGAAVRPDACCSPEPEFVGGSERGGSPAIRARIGPVQR